MLRSPFESENASATDAYYKYFYTNEQQKFWENKEITTILKYLEKEDPGFQKHTFIDLINRLLEVDPKKRITITQALQHPFLKDNSEPKSQNN